MTGLRLIIGNRTYSSWSMRAWLALTQSAAPFDETVIPLYEPTSRADILRLSPSGRVPCLQHGALTVWDSLAICEYVADLFPDCGLWPADRDARAVARAISAEMHSGFRDLRQALPMNVRRRFIGRNNLSPAVQEDVERVLSLWRDAMRHFGGSGPYLFGAIPTIADWMYAPVVMRFVSYDIAVSDDARAYMDTILAHPAVTRWIAEAEIEPWIIAKWE